jgi:hypothetical protein
MLGAGVSPFSDDQFSEGNPEISGMKMLHD